MSFFKNTKVDTTKSFDDEDSDNDSSSDSLSDDNESDDSGELEELDDKPTSLENDNTITVFGDKNGRRTNTYIVGLNTTDELRKSYLKSLKTKYACNGSIKKITYDNVEQIAIHLQGDQILNVKAFLIKEKVQQPINVKLID
jgi:translation initiation factor 1 (eIF-1/SUI1)